MSISENHIILLPLLGTPDGAGAIARGIQYASDNRVATSLPFANSSYQRGEYRDLHSVCVEVCQHTNLTGEMGLFSISPVNY